MSRKFEFSYPYAAYQDISLMRETHTRKELLEEYRKMQKEANRRLKQLSKYKYTQRSEAYRYNRDLYKKSPSKMNKTQLAKLMQQASRFLASQASTIKGQRERRARLIYTLKEEWGLDFVNASNVSGVIEFLEAARTNLGAGNYNMTEIEAMYRMAKTEKIDIGAIKQNFIEFYEKMNDDPNFEKYKREAEERYNPDNYDW
jgi:hypothetical protein